MVLPLLLGGLLVAAVVVATTRQYITGRSHNGPIGLDVKQSSKSRCDCL